MAHNEVMNSELQRACIVKTTNLRPLLNALTYPVRLTWHTVTFMSRLQNRERARLQEELSQTRGLMPLLMKQRNGSEWSTEDRNALRKQLRIIWGISPYVFLLVVPGGLVALPIFAWWLDRRRQNRLEEAKIK
jgi:hypothetical protein